MPSLFKRFSFDLDSSIEDADSDFVVLPEQDELERNLSGGIRNVQTVVDEILFKLSENKENKDQLDPSTYERIKKSLLSTYETQIIFLEQLYQESISQIESVVLIERISIKIESYKEQLKAMQDPKFADDYERIFCDKEVLVVGKLSFYSDDECDEEGVQPATVALGY